MNKIYGEKNAYLMKKYFEEIRVTHGENVVVQKPYIAYYIVLK